MFDEINKKSKLIKKLKQEYNEMYDKYFEYKNTGIKNEKREFKFPCHRRI